MALSETQRCPSSDVISVQLIIVPCKDTAVHKLLMLRIVEHS